MFVCFFFCWVFFFFFLDTLTLHSSPGLRKRQITSQRQLKNKKKPKNQPEKLIKSCRFIRVNAPAHKSVVPITAAHDCDFELVDHPPYSPDLFGGDLSWSSLVLMKQNLLHQLSCFPIPAIASAKLPFSMMRDPGFECIHVWKAAKQLIIVSEFRWNLAILNILIDK